MLIHAIFFIKERIFLSRNDTQSFFFFLTILTLIYTYTIPVQAVENERCPAPNKMAAVNVKKIPAKIIYKAGHSRSDIERQQLKRGRHVARGKWKILGLTQTEFKYLLKTTAAFKKTTRGRYCAYPVSFNLDIGYSDFIVYIDRKYRPSTCAYQAILKHEKTHISIYKQQLKRNLSYIKQQLRLAARSVRPVIVSTPDDGTKYIQDKVQSRIRPLILKLKREIDFSNAKIDTPENYRKVQLQCKDW